jgi:hypothetical protein
MYFQICLMRASFAPMTQLRYHFNIFFQIIGSMAYISQNLQDLNYFVLDWINLCFCTLEGVLYFRLNVPDVDKNRKYYVKTAHVKRLLLNLNQVQKSQVQI